MTTVSDTTTVQNVRRKLALTIGIGKYEYGLSLSSPENDAISMYDTLESIGFIIDEPKLNLKLNEMKDVVNRFIQSIEQHDVVFFYFAGHGYQLNKDNYYMIPSDDGVLNADNMKNKAVELADVLQRIEKKNPCAIITVLDCIHKYKLPHHNEATREDKKKDNLNKTTGYYGHLLVFARQSEVTVEYDTTRKAGLFAKNLINYIPTVSEDIRVSLAKAVAATNEETRSKQRPVIIDNLQISILYLRENSIVTLANCLKSERVGQTIAGGNTQGNALNQLYCPRGICIDEQQTMYIIDCFNHRILKWKSNAQVGEIVAGGNGKGAGRNQLNEPTDALLDSETNCLFICDAGNKRLIRWSLASDVTEGEVILEKIACYGLAMDNQRHLYITDTENNSIIRYNLEKNESQLAAGGRGRGDLLYQFNYPTNLFVDVNHTIYVSDSKNHRIVKWERNAKEGVIIAGGRGEGTSRIKLIVPRGIAVDSSENIYVADSGNHRVMVYKKNSVSGEILAGGNGFGSGTNQFKSPTGLAFDKNNKIYIVDYGNHRIQQFDL